MTLNQSDLKKDRQKPSKKDKDWQTKEMTDRQENNDRQNLTDRQRLTDRKRLTGRKRLLTESKENIYKLKNKIGNIFWSGQNQCHSTGELAQQDPS